MHPDSLKAITQIVTLTGEWRSRRLPWWKAVLKRKRTERYWHDNGILGRLVEREPVPPGTRYDTVQVPRFTALSDGKQDT